MQQLDFRAIFKLLLSKWYILLALAVVGAVALACFSMFFMPVEYRTGVSMYVSNLTNAAQSPTHGTSYSELISAERLILTYVDILENRSTMEKVQPNLSRSVTVQQLSDMISISGIEDTAIMYISVTAEDSLFAAEVCNAMADVAPKVFEQYQIGGSVKVVGEALPGGRVSTTTTRMAMIGAILGVLVAAVILVIRDMTDNTVRTPAALKQRIQVPVLGVIPAFEQGTKMQQKRRGGHEHA